MTAPGLGPGIPRGCTLVCYLWYQGYPWARNKTSLFSCTPALAYQECLVLFLVGKLVYIYATLIKHPILNTPRGLLRKKSGPNQCCSKFSFCPYATSNSEWLVRCYSKASWIKIKGNCSSELSYISDYIV